MMATKYDRVIERLRNTPRLLRPTTKEVLAAIDEAGHLRVVALGGIKPEDFPAFAAWVADLAAPEPEDAERLRKEAKAMQNAYKPVLKT